MTDREQAVKLMQKIDVSKLDTDTLLKNIDTIEGFLANFSREKFNEGFTAGQKVMAMANEAIQKLF